MSFRFAVAFSRISLALLALFPLVACSAIVHSDVGSLPPAMESPDAGPVIHVDLGARDLGSQDLGPVVEVDLGGPACSGATRCVGGEFIECVGGREQRTACPLGCATGAATRCAQFVPSNLSADSFAIGTADLDVGAGEVMLLNADTCEVEGIATHLVAQAGGPSLCVLIVRNLRVRTGGTLMPAGAHPLVVLASGDIDIEGTIDVSADQGRPGPGGGMGGGGAALDGTGRAGGTRGAHVDSFDDGGGGGGGLCGAGGAGGQGGTATGGTGGGAISTELTPLVGGSGGGSGRGSVVGASSLGGGGGGGGGALQLSAYGRLRLSGALLTGGGGGGGGGITTSGAVNWGSGGGGGSGGAMLLEAPSIEVTATARLVAAGGGGGGGAAGARSGASGGDGTAMPPSAGGAGGGGPFDAGGGAGALRSMGGTNGGANSMSTANGGGGGGGGGCVVARTGDGTLTGGSAVATPAGALQMLLARRR